MKKTLLIIWIMVTALGAYEKSVDLTNKYIYADEVSTLYEIDCRKSSFLGIDKYKNENINNMDFVLNVSFVKKLCEKTNKKIKVSLSTIEENNLNLIISQPQIAKIKKAGIVDLGAFISVSKRKMFSSVYLGKVPIVKLEKVYINLEYEDLENSEFPIEIKNIKKDNNGYIEKIEFNMPSQIIATNTYDIDNITECINGKIWIKKYGRTSGQGCYYKIKKVKWN